jgi:hypothetical protein
MPLVFVSPNIANYNYSPTCEDVTGMRARLCTTLAVRAATSVLGARCTSSSAISPRLPCGGTQHSLSPDSATAQDKRGTGSEATQSNFTLLRPNLPPAPVTYNVTAMASARPSPTPLLTTSLSKCIPTTLRGLAGGYEAIAGGGRWEGGLSQLASQPWRP